MLRSSAQPWNVALFLALAVYVGIATWIVWIEFAFSVDGFVSVIGGSIGTFAIPGLIALAVSFRKKSKFPYLVAITLSAAVLVNSHWSGILDSYDAREYKAEMAKATPQNVFEILRNSKTHIGQTINVSFTVMTNNYKQIQIFFQTLDDDQFKDVLTAETLQSPERIASLSKIAIAKRQIAATADAKLDAIFDTTYQELQASMQGLSPRMQSNVLAGYKESSVSIRGLFKQYAHTYLGVYDNLLGMYGILQNNAGKYFVKGPASVVIYDNEAAAQFNTYFKGLTENFKEMADIQGKIAVIQKNGVGQIIHSADN